MVRVHRHDFLELFNHAQLRLRMGVHHVAVAHGCAHIDRIIALFQYIGGLMACLACIVIGSHMVDVIGDGHLLGIAWLQETGLCKAR